VSADRLAFSSVRRVFAEVSVQHFAARGKSRSVLAVVVALFEVCSGVSDGGGGGGGQGRGCCSRAIASNGQSATSERLTG
jgi:hypothetical protein